MPGLVVFLHGLMGSRRTWRDVPNFLQNSLGDDFRVVTPEYSAKIKSRANMATSAAQITTLIETDYPNYEPIFFVGHSMGGLIAREICRELLTNGPDGLLNKITAAISAGTPLEGARYGNWLLRKLPLVGPKIHQLADSESTFADYREAILEAKQRRVRRPKQLHIRMEDDGVIAAHVSRNFTEDDEPAGVIRGTHTNFADTPESARFVADVILSAIRKAQNSVSAPNISRPAIVQAENLPDRLIVIACSHGKRAGGHRLEGPSPVAWIPQESLRQRIISKRNYVYTILKEAKLEDGFERGGNRAHQPANLALIHGRDLGGVVGDDGSYLPAFQRYNGRIYVPITEASWQSYFNNVGRVRVLIMSGLYGLVEPDEQIQNYDVHLTDTNRAEGINVRSMWLELYTEALDAYVRYAHRGRKVKIFNFLCDRNYVDAVQWHSLPRDLCSVFHFTSPNASDVNLLPPAGTVIKAIFDNPELLEGFEREESAQLYALTDYGAPPSGLGDLRFRFESRVGITQ